jgi:hypothetical protein
MMILKRTARKQFTARMMARDEAGHADAMNIDPTWLFLSLFPSGAGFVLFVYGKKEQRWPQLGAGLLLMVYPYFATSTTTLVAGGLIVGIGLWGAIRLGW